MAESAGSGLCLSEMLRQTTEALTVLDAAAIERLLGELRGVGSGEAEVRSEPLEAIVQKQRVLGAVLTETGKNLKVLGRLHARQSCAFDARSAFGRGRSPWEQ